MPTLLANRWVQLSINGLLYIVKGASALIVPLANVMVAATGTWTAVLLVMAPSSLGAGLLAKLAVEPMRRKMKAPQALPSKASSIAAGVT